MRTVYQTVIAGFPIKLEQRENGTFRVTYGKERRDRCSYENAAARLGEAIMHALQCDGQIIVRTIDEQRGMLLDQSAEGMQL